MSLSLSIYVYTQTGTPSQLASISKSAPSGVTVNCYPSPTARLTTTYTWSALAYGCPDGFSFSGTKGGNATCLWTSTRPALDLTWSCLYTIAGGLTTVTGNGGTTTLTSTPTTQYVTVTETQQSTLTSTTNLAPGGITQTLTSTITQAPIAARRIQNENEIDESLVEERDIDSHDGNASSSTGLYIEDWSRPESHRIRPPKEMVTNFTSPLLERACSATDISCPGGQCCSKNNSMCIGTFSCCAGFGCIRFAPAAPFEKAMIPKVLLKTTTSYHRISVSTKATETSTTNVITIETTVETQTELYSISSTASIALVTVTGQPKVVNDTGTIVGGVVGGIAGIVLISAAIFWLLTRRRYNRGYKPTSSQQPLLMTGAVAGNYSDQRNSGGDSYISSTRHSQFNPGQQPGDNGAEGYYYPNRAVPPVLAGQSRAARQTYQPLSSAAGPVHESYLIHPALRDQATQGQQAYDPTPPAPPVAAAVPLSAAQQQRAQYQDYEQRQNQAPSLQNQSGQYQPYQTHQRRISQPVTRGESASLLAAAYQDQIEPYPASIVSPQQTYLHPQANAESRTVRGLGGHHSATPSMDSTYQTYHTPIPSPSANFADEKSIPRTRRESNPTSPYRDDPRTRHIPGQSPTFEIHEMHEFLPYAPRYS